MKRALVELSARIRFLEWCDEVPIYSLSLRFSLNFQAAEALRIGASPRPTSATPRPKPRHVALSIGPMNVILHRVKLAR